MSKMSSSVKKDSKDSFWNEFISESDLYSVVGHRKSSIISQIDAKCILSTYRNVDTIPDSDPGVAVLENRTIEAVQAILQKITMKEADKHCIVQILRHGQIMGERMTLTLSSRSFKYLRHHSYQPTMSSTIWTPETSFNHDPIKSQDAFDLRYYDEGDDDDLVDIEDESIDYISDIDAYDGSKLKKTASLEPNSSNSSLRLSISIIPPKHETQMTSDAITPPPQELPCT